jgi:ribosomal-protein-alanine N-acetyltransferase
MSVTPPPTFTTARLHLRQPTLADAPTIFARYTQDPEVARYMVWRPHTSVVESERFLQRCVAVWADGSAFPYVIERREDGLLLGMIEFRVDGFIAEFGYVLARDAWGHGYMPEALTCLVDWVLTQPTIYRAAAFHDVDNPASGRVMQKAGMSYEGRLRRHSLHPNVSDEPRDCHVYARVR